MDWVRSEEEVDKMIEDMMNRTKGGYIIQAVAFNKKCPRQMGLLKKALMSSVSFSGLGKELLAIKFNGGNENNAISSVSSKYNEPQVKDFGNFI